MSQTQSALQHDDNARETIRRLLRDKGGVCDEIACGYADLICREFAGEAIYFAIREWCDVATRDEDIRQQRHAGRSWQWLANHFCLSRTQIRRICQAQ